MQFQVPQFIEVEDKIVGPLTFKQFVYLLGGAGASYILWSLFPAIVAIIFIAPIAALALALAFFKVNGRPFIVALEKGFVYLTGGKLYLWKKQEKAIKRTVEILPSERQTISVPKLTEGKLKDIAWSLDIKERQR